MVVLQLSHYYWKVERTLLARMTKNELRYTGQWDRTELLNDFLRYDAMILNGARTEKFDFEIKTLTIITLCKEEINFDAFFKFVRLV